MWSKTMKKACTKFIFSRTANLEPAIVLKMKLFTGNFHRLWQKILYQLFLETRFRGRSCCCIQHVSYCVYSLVCILMFFFTVFTCFIYMFLHLTCFYTLVSIFRLRYEGMLTICEANYPTLTWTFGETFLQSYKVLQVKRTMI